MVKVITYGTYDLLHHGHIRLLERAKALGDYLIVGVTADDFDKTRGKINVQQSLMERVEAVKATGIADEVIIEEYEGQKIDDIRRYGVDIFTVGSDWVGKFDYLREYCEVIYLPRTEGISSSELRQSRRAVSLGLVGDADFLNKIEQESRFVNGIHVAGICTRSLKSLSAEIQGLDFVTENYEELLERVDAVYIRSQPEEHYKQVKLALERGKHVLCEAATLDDTRSFFADWTIRHPDIENGELLQHCGPWPLSVAGCKPCIPYPLAFDYPGAITAEAKHGELTLARFDGDNGEYSLLLGNAKGVDGPKGMGTYLWVEVENIKRLEAKIVEGPYIHHCVGIHRDVVPVLYEACKYIGVKPDLYDPIEENVKAYLRGE